MIGPEEWMDIKELHRQGLSQRKIAELTGHARKTIRNTLAQKAPEPFHKPARKSRLDPFKPYLQSRYEQYGLSGVRLHQEIVAQGFTGSLDIVQRYIKTLKQEKTRRSKMTVRFETAPGQQAQADWAEVGRFEGQKIYAFIIVLSFSRLLYVEFTKCMDLPELLSCHQRAFAYLGGIPGSILYDNMAQVRKPGSGDLNPLMADFAAHYGFAVKTHQPYRPRTKGKVERMVDYLKDNFLNGRSFAGLEDLAAQGRHWLEEANQRVHATTGERPVALLQREKLTPLSRAMPYVLALRQERKVDAEGFVHLKRSRYSVPPQYVGKRVLVIQKERQVLIRLGETIIAEHPLAPSPGACVVHKEHVAAMWRESLSRPVLPAPRVRFTDAEAVAVRPLSVYEEAARQEEVREGALLP